jgi:hypothetical protein
MNWIVLAGQGPVEGYCESVTEPSSSIKCCEVLEWLHNRLLSSIAQIQRVNYERQNRILSRM